MLKLPNSFVDPTLRTLSLQDYFNPTVNKLFVSGRKNLTVSEIVHFFTALYTRENLLANLDLFYPPEVTSGYGMTAEDLAHMISKIEDEDLWQLAFLAFSSLSSTGNKLGWVKNPIVIIDWSSSSRRLDCNFSRSGWQMNYSFRGDNFAEEMKTTLRELGTMFKSLEADRPGYTINMETYIHGNATLGYMCKFAANRKYCVSSEYTAETLAHDMQTNTNLVIRLTTHNYQFCKIILTNPVTRDNKRPLFQTLSYSADVLELLPWPLVTKGERNPMLYGVELEVSTNYNTQQLIEAGDEPFFACKVDSSITGSMRHKLELVTVPASMKAHKKEWSHIFSNLDYDLFDTTIDTNNGMHVHIGRQAFNDKHLRTFAWFFGNPCNREFVIALSERKENQMHQYASMPHWQPNMTKTASLKTVVDYFDMLRGAVNLHKSKPTVEVRIFKGIASYATILKNLEAVDAIFFFTQQCSQTSAGLREFLNFLRKTPRNKYPVLKEFIATLDTKKMLSAAQLNDLVFNIQDPRQIVSIIQKKNFPITSHHVSLLNAKQGVRTFIFNKDHGTIEIVRTKHGKMSHLDRVLEKKYTRNARPFIEAVPPAATNPIQIPDDWFTPDPGPINSFGRAELRAPSIPQRNTNGEWFIPYPPTTAPFNPTSEVQF